MRNEIFYGKAQELRYIFKGSPIAIDIICDIMKVVFTNNDVLPDDFHISGHHYSLTLVSDIVNKLSDGRSYSVTQNGDFFFCRKI